MFYFTKNTVRKLILTNQLINVWGLNIQTFEIEN